MASTQDIRAARQRTERRAAVRLIAEGVANGYSPDVAGIAVAMTFPGVPVG